MNQGHVEVLVVEDDDAIREVLREMRPRDVASLHRLFGDPLLMRFWPVFTWDETTEWVAKEIRRYAQGWLRPLGHYLQGQRRGDWRLWDNPP